MCVYMYMSMYVYIYIYKTLVVSSILVVVAWLSSPARTCFLFYHLQRLGVSPLPSGHSCCLPGSYRDEGENAATVSTAKICRN